MNWVGFPATYDSWEPAVELYDDIGSRVTKYIAANMKDNEAMQQLLKVLKRRKRKPKRK